MCRHNSSSRTRHLSALPSPNQLVTFSPNELFQLHPPKEGGDDPCAKPPGAPLPMQNALSSFEGGREEGRKKSPDGLVFHRCPTALICCSIARTAPPHWPPQDDHGKWLCAPLLLLAWPPLNCVDSALRPHFYLVPPKKSPCHWENCLAGFLKSASLGSVREAWIPQLLSCTRPQSVAGCPFQLSSPLPWISYPPALVGTGRQHFATTTEQLVVAMASGLGPMMLEQGRGGRRSICSRPPPRRPV